MPEWIGVFEDRLPIASFLQSGQGLVAGILAHTPSGDGVLQDDSGSLMLPADALSQLPLVGSNAHLLAVFAEQRPVASAPSAAEQNAAFEVHVRRVVYCQPIEETPEFLRIRRQHVILAARSRILSRLRQWFVDRGFLEMDTPVHVACPGVEEFLEYFQCEGGYLRTSPELHMKRLLVGGFDRIFQLGPCFRRGERGRLHRPEFHMLEWYRRFADLGHIVRDVKDLLKAFAQDAVDDGYFQRGVDETTCQALFRETLGLELRDQSDTAALKQCAADLNVPFDESDDWDTLYFRLFLNCIEPKLGLERPVLVHDFPSSQAALAKKKQPEPGEFPTCYRFELYMRGIEIANAFYELCDAERQERRFEATRRKREQAGQQSCPSDPAFLSALRCGMPPSAGIAWGVDRWVMLLLGLDRLDHVLPF